MRRLTALIVLTVAIAALVGACTPEQRERFRRHYCTLHPTIPACRNVGTTSTTTTSRPSTVKPPPDANEDDGSFRVECDLSHRAQADPIVAPGGISAHKHDFFGNERTHADSTYATMRAATTTCTADGDTAGYWAPTLVAPDRSPAPVETAIFYYRNRPTDYSRTMDFPRDLRIIAGAANLSTAYVYWTCDGESDTGFEGRKRYVPDCRNTGDDHQIKMHIWFPSCWDGVNLDSPDHRSHMAYGIDDDGRVEPTDPDRCPPSHPIKVPQLNFRVQYDVADGRGYRFSDGEVLPHADFWNTWDQAELSAWVSECLRGGESCGLAEGKAG